MEPNHSNNHPIDELFRQRLENHAVPPPAMAWDRMATELQADSVSGATSRSAWNMVIPFSLLLGAFILSPIKTGLRTDHQNSIISSDSRHFIQRSAEKFAVAQLASGWNLQESIESAPGGDINSPAVSLKPKASTHGNIPQMADIGTIETGLEKVSTTTQELSLIDNQDALRLFSLLPAAEEMILPDLLDNGSDASVLNLDNKVPVGEMVSLAVLPTDQMHLVESHDAEISNSGSQPNHQPTTSSVSSRLYTGLQASVQWTGLLNSKGPESDENLEAMVNIGQAYGFTLGYVLSNRLQLETGLVLDSRQGSRYLGTVTARKEEVEVTKSLHLHYTQIPLTIRVRTNPSHHVDLAKASWSYVGGFQYGFLRNSRLSIDDKNVNPDREIQQHEISALLGLDCDIPLQDRMFLTVGFRGSLGLNSTKLNGVDVINQDKRNAVLCLRVAMNGFLLPQ